MRRKILIVCGQLALGGAERELVTFLAAVRGGPWEFRVACLNEGGEFRPDVERLSGHAVQTSGTGSRWMRLRWLRRLIQEWRPDLIHAWNLYPMFYLKMGFVRRPCPILGFLQNIPSQARKEDFHSWIFPFLARAPDGVVSNSQAALTELGQMGIPVRRSKVVHNAVASPFFDAEPLDEVMARKGPRLVVVAVGRLIVRKRTDWMIRAVHDLSEQGLDFDLWLVGAGPEEDSLRALARKLGVEEQVVFWGARLDVQHILPAADVFLHCAAAEGLPNAVQEAMAAGLPVVASDTSGIPEIVTPGAEGLLYATHDYGACLAALKNMLGDEALRKMCAARARARAERDFRPETMAQHMLDFYAETMDHWRRRIG